MRGQDFEGWDKPHEDDRTIFYVPYYTNKGYWTKPFYYELNKNDKPLKGLCQWDYEVINGKMYKYIHVPYYFDENGNELFYEGHPDPVEEARKKAEEERLIGGRPLPKRIDDFNRYYSFSSGPAIPICIIISLLCILMFNDGWLILFVTIPYIIYGIYKEVTYGTKWK